MSIERTGFGQGGGDFTCVACEFGDLVARKGLLARGRHGGGMPNGQQRLFSGHGRNWKRHTGGRMHGCFSMRMVHRLSF